MKNLSKSDLPFVNTFGVRTFVLQGKWDTGRHETFFCYLQIAFPALFKIFLDNVLEIIYCLSIVKNQFNINNFVIITIEKWFYMRENISWSGCNLADALGHYIIALVMGGRIQFVAQFQIQSSSIWFLLPY